MWMKYGGEQDLGKKSYFCLVQGFLNAWGNTQNTSEKRDREQDAKIFYLFGEIGQLRKD